MVIHAGFSVLFILLIWADSTGRIDVTRPVFRTALLAIYLNIPAWIWISKTFFAAQNAPIWRLVMLLGVFFWTRIHMRPFRTKEKVSLRLRVMMGGRTLARMWITALAVGAVSLFVLWRTTMPWQTYAANAVWMAVFAGLLFANGTFRMFFTSRRLSVLYRVLILIFWWVPIVNLVVLRKCCRLCNEEYDFALYKAVLHEIRAESNLCQTRYPVVMVHGILFRDLRYFNYWGRIPRELKRLGATVYFGNQEAVGTVVRNATDLRSRIDEIMRETGSEKVNIIAHSKGGLDSRYAISKLGAAPYVASLTTICTPHHGVKFADGATKMPEKLYRFLAKCFDTTFRKLGDKEPDFYTATQQFRTADSSKFNAETPDAPNVYYQSYASKMRGLTSDGLLAVPYFFGKRCEGDNDGLVSVTSAKWGEFRGVLSAPGRRGVSHGDVIDLRREDIKGFDVVETYVQIVRELKERGF